MRILITTAVWGERYRKLFADCSVASLLATWNLPALARHHKVTFQVVTTRQDAEWLAGHPNLALLATTCRAELIYMEDYGLGPAAVPAPADQAKYAFVTRLQNIAIDTAQDYDAMVFNYADFVWADGSLPKAVNLLGAADAVLGFCLPMDMAAGTAALSERTRDGVLAIMPRELAGLCLDNLHVEATYRLSDAPEFTRLPSYLLFREGNDMTVRAYHQTALVARVSALNGGIGRGTLDGNFTSELAQRGPVVHADNSDRVMVVSLHDGQSNPRMRGGNREDTIAAFERQCTPEQRAFAKVPLYVRR